jgi:hypothetical protein
MAGAAPSSTAPAPGNSEKSTELARPFFFGFAPSFSSSTTFRAAAIMMASRASRFSAHVKHELGATLTDELSVAAEHNVRRPPRFGTQRAFLLLRVHTSAI